MRRLLCKYDPQSPQANSALLKNVLHPSQCSLIKLREGLESWENLERKYEDRRKKPLVDDICRSCLQQMCPNKLQDHLDVQAPRLTSYDQVKAEALAYLENVETRTEAKSGAVFMDLDSLAKGKGKGKHDKGKGKGKSKGKDKGKGNSTNWSNNSSNKGSWNQQSRNQQSWQKQNTNDSKGKGKGKKGQDKGKGKGDQGKSRKVANVESDAWAQEQQPAAPSGEQPEPEVTAMFTLEEVMPSTASECVWSLVEVEVQNGLLPRHPLRELWPEVPCWWLRMLWHLHQDPMRSRMARWFPKLRVLWRKPRKKGLKQIKLSKNDKTPWTSWRKRQLRRRKRSSRRWPKWGWKQTWMLECIPEPEPTKIDREQQATELPLGEKGQLGGKGLKKHPMDTITQRSGTRKTWAQTCQVLSPSGVSSTCAGGFSGGISSTSSSVGSPSIFSWYFSS